MEFLKQYEVLFKKARTDLKAGKNLLADFENGDDELDLETIMFHLQQCAEKLIKALLDFNKLKFPHTHDIEILLILIKSNNIKIPLNTDILENLTDYAVEGRYAIVHDDIEDAHAYINLLEKLKIFVQITIKND